MNAIPKHQGKRKKRVPPQRKVFVSFHENDEHRKDEFVQLMAGRIIDLSVDAGEIHDTNNKTANIRRTIRDDYVRRATVTVVLIGRKTWQRKHVDWEIQSSLRDSDFNKRNGLLGVILPDHPSYGRKLAKAELMPPRLADNCHGDDPFAHICDWPEPFAPARVHAWIETAFQRRVGTDPNNTRRPFKNNRTTDWRKGWQ